MSPIFVLPKFMDRINLGCGGAVDVKRSEETTRRRVWVGGCFYTRCLFVVCEPNRWYAGDEHPIRVQSVGAS